MVRNDLEKDKCLEKKQWLIIMSCLIGCVSNCRLDEDIEAGGDEDWRGKAEQEQQDQVVHNEGPRPDPALDALCDITE